MKPEHRPSLRCALIAPFLLLVPACATARPAGPAPAPEPAEVWETAAEMETEVRPPERDILGSVVYDLPVEANSWVESELDFLVGQRSEVIASWLERGDFYEPYIKQVLGEHQIPTDLYHLAMIESGFVATARSRAGAVGMWQFMPATGRAMGLRVDAEVDERMDPVRSTRAAARHLRSLHRSLGDWALAAAAYNAGTGRITRGLSGFGVSNFWDLAQHGDLAEETRRYVPRLYAVTVIGRDRTRFGFSPPDQSDQFAYDSVQVEFPTPLSELSRIGGPGEAELRRLNPHLLSGITPAGGYWVWVPNGRGAEVQRAWLASDFRRDRGLGTYTVRPGDNLGMLAERAGVGSARIRELNPSVEFDPLQIGVELRLPYTAAQTLTARPARQAPTVAVATPARSDPGASAPGSASAAAPVEAPAAAARPLVAGRTHVVAAGETLWSISRVYEVTVEAIEKANSLNGSAIRAGQTLAIPGVPTAAVAAMPTSAAPAPGLATRPGSAEHVVSPGESLWGIARQYGSTVAAIEAANDLGDRPIQPGQRLVIPATARD